MGGVQLKKLIVLLMLLVVCSVVVCADPTQISNKIYLSPFYRAQMVSGTNYSYSLIINPPDGFNSVSSAIVSIDSWTSPTDVFNLSINNLYCNNKVYTIPTGFGSSRTAAVFDCSNVIIAAGNYSVQVSHRQSSNVNASSVTAWVDVTYTNQPIGQITVKGTEYVQGDVGTIFVQLNDAYGSPVSNGSCLLDIFSPLVNGFHSQIVSSAPMVNTISASGLYFYDMNPVPVQIGVYMVSVLCSYQSQATSFYPETEINFVPIIQPALGTWTGSNPVLNNRGDNLYIYAQGTGGLPVVANFTYNLSAYGVLPNITQLNLFFSGQGQHDGFMFFSWWNGTQYRNVSNNLTLVGTGSANPTSDGEQFFSTIIPIAAIINNTVRIRVMGTGTGTHWHFLNWMMLTTQIFIGQVTNVKGGGEIHVSPSTSILPDYTVDTCNGFLDGRCSYATNNDSDFNLAEGELEEQFQVSGIRTKMNQTIMYITPYMQDCTALYWIREWNGSVWNNFTDYSIINNPSGKQCDISLYKNIISGQQYKFWIKSDNYGWWEATWSKQIFDVLNFTIPNLCPPFNYSVPIIEGQSLSNDLTTNYCYQMFDDLYYSYFYFNGAKASLGNAGNFSSFLVEVQFYRDNLMNKVSFLGQDAQLRTEFSTNSSVNRNLEYIKANNVSVQEILGIVKHINQTVLTNNALLQDINYSVVRNGVLLQNINGSVNSFSVYFAAINATLNRVNVSVNDLAFNLNQLNVSVASVNRSVSSMNDSSTLLPYLFSLNASVHGLNDSSSLIPYLQYLNQSIHALNDSSSIVPYLLTINSSVSGVRSDVLALNTTLQYLLALDQYMNGSVGSINQSIGVVRFQLVQSLSSLAIINSSLNEVGVKSDALNVSLLQLNGSLSNLSFLVNSVNSNVNATYYLVLDVNKTQSNNYQSLTSLIQLLFLVNSSSTNDVPIFTSVSTDGFQMEPNAVITVSALLSINQSQANISNVWYEVEYNGVRANYSASPVTNLNWSFSFSSANLGTFYFRNAFANSTRGNLTIAPLSFAVTVQYAGNGGFSGMVVAAEETPVVPATSSLPDYYLWVFAVVVVVLFLLAMILIKGKG